MARALIITGADFSSNKIDTVTFDGEHTTAISLSADAISFNEIGATQRLYATVYPIDSTDPVYWSSSDHNVASVGQNGLVTVTGCGRCTITAASGQYSDTCDIVVEIELTGYGRYVKSEATPASNSNTNDLTRIYSLYGNSYGAKDKQMLMCDVDQTQTRLTFDYNIVQLNQDTNQYYIENPLPYRTSDDSSRSIGYCVPILLPANCTKVRCIAPADHYASYALFYDSDMPASTSSPQYVLCAHRYYTGPNNSGYAWDYTVREKEFNVPAGADSVTVSWYADTDSGAVNFANMASDLLNQFKIIAC